jgi:hypothetical protein
VSGLVLGVSAAALVVSSVAVWGARRQRIRARAAADQARASAKNAADRPATLPAEGWVWLNQCVYYQRPEDEQTELRLTVIVPRGLQGRVIAGLREVPVPEGPRWSDSLFELMFSGADMGAGS